jgi:hypothetical protein
MGAAVLQLQEDGTAAFHCPACDEDHFVKVEGEGAWDWQGGLEEPTFRPSILVSWGNLSSSRRCHSWINEGRITYEQDSTHDMAGLTATLPEW